MYSQSYSYTQNKGHASVLHVYTHSHIHTHKIKDMLETVRVWYIPYAYGTYHTRMAGMFFCTIRVWLYRTRIYVSHSIKLSTWTGGSTYTQKVYYSSQGYQKRSNSL